MGKGVLICLVFVFVLLGLVCAHGYYDEDSFYGGKIVGAEYYSLKYEGYRTTYVYGKDEGYFGYDYWKRDYDKSYGKWRYDKSYGKGNYDKGYFYEYVPHLREYRGRACYREAPRDKLFYIKCPY